MELPMDLPMNCLWFAYGLPMGHIMGIWNPLQPTLTHAMFQTLRQSTHAVWKWENNFPTLLPHHFLDVAVERYHNPNPTKRIPGAAPTPLLGRRCRALSPSKSDQTNSRRCSHATFWTSLSSAITIQIRPNACFTGRLTETSLQPPMDKLFFRSSGSVCRCGFLRTPSPQFQCCILVWRRSELAIIVSIGDVQFILQH